VAETIAFKPYACGTMIHPYIDCARRLAARGIAPDDVVEIVCETAEGIVHRLWEPLADKQRPPNGYAAKFSAPFCVAYAMLHGAAGLDAFTDGNAADPRIVALASRVRYAIDPRNPYPNEYTGHIRMVSSRDGAVVELRQPHLRGGHAEPLARAEIEEKFRANCAHGGWTGERAERWLAFARGAFDNEVDLKEFRG
jgi:2-methylcitrate dehydratase PrpD